MASRREYLYSVFVGDLPVDIEEEDVVDLFSSCGSIEDLYISSTQKNGFKFGFVRYSTPGEVIKAVSQLHRWKIKAKRPIIVDFASDTADRIKKYEESIKSASHNDSPKIELRKNRTSNQIDDDRIKQSDSRKEKQQGSNSSNKCLSPASNSKNVKLSPEDRLNYFSAHVGRLHKDVTEKEFRDLFSSCGCIQDMFIYTYRDSGNKFGIVRYSSHEEVCKAISKLNGKMMKKQAIMVGFAHDTVERIQRKSNERPSKESEEGSSWKGRSSKMKTQFYSVYVGGLHASVTEKEIRDLFSGCGCIQDMHIGTYEDTGNKYGFIRYSSPQEALNAISHLHGWRVKNQAIVVDFANDTKGRMQKGKASDDIVPCVEVSLDFPDNMTSTSLEIESVINRSRVQEACCILRSKMTHFKGSTHFSRILDQLDNWDCSHKVLALQPDLSQRSNLSAPDISEQILSQCSQHEDDIFADKYFEVTRNVERLLREEKPQSPVKSSSQTSNQGKTCTVKPSSSSPAKGAKSPGKKSDKANQGSKSRMQTKDLSHPDRSGRLPSSIDLCSPISGNTSPVMPVVSTPQSSPARQRSSDKQITHSGENTSLFERGRMLKKQIDASDEKLLHRAKNLSQSHVKSTEEKPAEMLQTVGREERELYDPTEELELESTGKGTPSWALDLFCQLVDTQSSRTRNESGWSSSSSEYSSAPDSSGYSSFYEGLENESFSQDSKSNGKKSLFNQAEDVSSEGTPLTHKSRLFSIPIK